MHCRHCARDLPEQAVVCVACGCSPATGNKFCQGCGGETLSAAEFCVRCGVRLRSGGLAPGQKSKLAAGLLGIFLGGLGVHRFYLGYVGIGIAQIAVSVVSCGTLGWIWGLIEGILILTGSTITTDAQGKPLGE